MQEKLALSQCVSFLILQQVPESCLKPMFWSSILAEAVISPSFIPKASSNTLELKSRSQFTEWGADAVK